MTTIDKHPVNTPSWFDLMTPDPDKARAFYGALFGWQFQVSGPEYGGYAMATTAGRSAAGVGKLPPGAPYPSAWTVYFGVDNADRTCAAIKEHGGNVMMGPMDVGDQGRMAIATDPTGAVFGLWQPKAHAGAGVKDQHGAMGWQECHTRDAVKARDFYAKVFGLEPKKIEGMDYWTLDRAGKQYGGVMLDKDLPAQVPPHWLAYFDVDDTDKAVATTTARGGKVIHPAFDTPHGRMAILADPFGAVFAVIRPPARA